MARAKQVKAAKDYPQFGIVKGQLHYYWKAKTGPYTSREYRQVKPPTRSQLTQSAFFQVLYDIQDSLNEENVTDAGGLRSFAERVEELRDETQEKLDNMPDGLQQGSTGELLQERIDGCESWAEAINEAADELESKLEELDNEEPEHAAAVKKWEEYETALEEFEEARDEYEDDPDKNDPPGEEPVAPEGGEPEERDFEEERRQALTEAIEAASEACEL